MERIAESKDNRGGNRNGFVYEEGRGGRDGAGRWVGRGAGGMRNKRGRERGDPSSRFQVGPRSSTAVTHHQDSVAEAESTGWL